MSTKSTYETSHHNFVRAYKMINEYVTGIYLLPQKLADDAGKTLDNYYIPANTPGSEEKINTSCRLVIDFMNQLDDFTVQTMQLFKEHKKHVNATREYMRRVSTAQLNHPGSPFEAGNDTTALLTPELNNLMDGLKEIKDKADKMITRLEKLEMRWENIKINNSAY